MRREGGREGGREEFIRNYQTPGQLGKSHSGKTSRSSVSYTSRHPPSLHDSRTHVCVCACVCVHAGFTRVVVSVYVVCAVSAVLRVQLSILGGGLFLQHRGEVSMWSCDHHALI